VNPEISSPYCSRYTDQGFHKFTVCHLSVRENPLDDVLFEIETYAGVQLFLSRYSGYVLEFLMLMYMA